VTETHYTYVTYKLADFKVDDTNTLTPRQQREIEQKFAKALNEAMDNKILEALAGGYYVPRPGGTTIDHVPRRSLLPKVPR
jgi:hypothetical protein